jgi:Tfp pilus assembly PilM family ATPase
MKNVIGIEIGKETLKVVLGQVGGIHQRILNVAVRPIAADDDKSVGAALVEVFAAWKIKPRNVILSLPRNQVTVRNLHLPSKDSGEMDRMIDLHLGRIVPYKKEEVVYTYTMSGNDTLGYTRIVLAIAYYDIIKRQMKLLDKAGVLPEGIVLSSCGIHAQICALYKADIRQMPLFIILDVDTDYTDFIVADKQQMYFTRSIAVKASALNEEEGRTRLIGQVRQSLVIFNNEEINEKPSMIYLSGFAQQGLADALSKELDIALTSVPGSGNTDSEKTTIASSTTAVERIAIDGTRQKLCFDIPEIQAQKSIRAKIRDLITLGVVGCYLAGILCMVFAARLYCRDGYRRELDRRSALIENDVGAMGRELDRIMLVKDHLQRRSVPVFLLDSLHKIMPVTVATTWISLDNAGKIVVRGEARESSDVFAFVNVLDQYEYFEQATANYTRKRKVKDREVTDFEVTFVMAAGIGGDL